MCGFAFHPYIYVHNERFADVLDAKIITADISKKIQSKAKAVCRLMVESDSITDHRVSLGRPVVVAWE